MASPSYETASFPPQSTRISVQLANDGSGLACSVSASWNRPQQEQSGPHSASCSTASVQEQEASERSGPDASAPEDTSSAFASAGEVSPAKSSPRRHLRHTVTGYARHAALMAVFLMICVALAVLIAYRMTFGMDDMSAGTQAVGGEVYPRILVPKLNEPTENLSEFKNWIQDLLDKMKETSLDSTVTKKLYEDIATATDEISSDTVYETASTATIYDGSNSMLGETLTTAGSETVNGTEVTA